MLRTKFVFTIGPASSSRDTLDQLIRLGMDVARINMSHVKEENYSEAAEIIQHIRGLSHEANRPVAILADLQGPKLRVGKMQQGGVSLEEGEEIVLTTDQVVGVPGRIPIQYTKLPNLVQSAEIIYLDDGLLALEVLHIQGNDIYARVRTGGILSDYKGMNFPDTTLNIDALTKKDRRDLLFVLQQEVDWIALSFVRSESDVLILKELIQRMHSTKPTIPVVSKIEKPEAIENIDSIIDVSDGVMVARGDLGVEIGSAKVPVVQKLIIERCHRASKPVIIATQMLDSMIRNPIPTRAEANDVANAVLDGADAVMLSGETANGSYALKAAETMIEIVEETESTSKVLDLQKRHGSPDLVNTRSVIAQTVVSIAEHLGAKAIIAPTISGVIAKMIASFHPPTPIIAVTPDSTVQRELCLYKGVVPLQGTYAENVEEIIVDSIVAAKNADRINSGDVVVLTSGIINDLRGATNSLIIHRVEQAYHKDSSTTMPHSSMSTLNVDELNVQPI